jgi:hypothetical protein
MILREGIGATDSIVKNIDQYIKRLCGQAGYEYIPMAKKDPDKLRLKDFIKLDRLARRCRSYFADSQRPQPVRPKDVEGFLRWLEGKQLIITGRYHTVTLCLLTKTPFLCFESNTPKISFLLNDVFGDTRRSIKNIEDIETINMDDYAVFSECEGMNIDAFTQRSIASNRDMFSDIKMCIQRHS